MANYKGYGRSNYVLVTDIDKFKEFLSQYNLQFIEKSGLVGCYSLEEDGDIPMYNDNDDPLPDFIEGVSELLADNEWFVWEHVGHEKLNYLVGFSFGVNNKGERFSVSIGDVYSKIRQVSEGVTEAKY